ncbi:MAG: PilC/PilY family type IV pilus protein [Betaproteobacteria bacterium]|nr:PilC/PilY family type IV pilus protein [Betaproteobacteria bacterium]
MTVQSSLSPRHLLAGLAAAALLCAAPAARSQALNIATEPLGTATTTILPNVMFILDDSGSMGWDYMPDYVNDTHNPTATTRTTASCYDAGDDNDPSAGSIKGSPDACVLGDPPYMSPDLNTIYYNPTIRYLPAVNYDGSGKPNQDAATTTNWTAVSTNEYYAEMGSTRSTTNLASGYPDRLWCKNKADADGTCLTNSAYSYPSFLYPYGTTSGGSTRYTYSNPYYYRFQTAQYCSDAARTSCRSGSSVDPTVDIYQALEYCTDVERTNCAAGAAVTAAHIYSGVRWCSDAGTLVNCQRKKIGAFLYAKHLGSTRDVTGTFAATANTGSITVRSVAATGGTISNLTIAGVPVIAAPITVSSGLSTEAAATLIATAISSYTSSPNFTATASGSVVNITQSVAGASGNGAPIVVSSSGSASASATGTVSVSTVRCPRSGSCTRTLSVVSVNATNLMCAPTVGQTTNFGNSVTVDASGNIVASSGWNASVERDAMLTAIAARVNACAVGGYTATLDLANSKVTLVAPLSQGATPNGYAVAATGTNLAAISTTPMGGGASNPDIATAVTTMAGGSDAFTGTRTLRIGVGAFTRTNIVTAVDSYPKQGGRTDCLGVTCTYAEEMTNFANWYTYYRNRITMMKSAAGRAFAPIGESYRVGFITINPGSTVSSSKYLKIDAFTTAAGGHKSLWYDKFYSQTTGSSTPLREALARVGWLYAGELNTGLTSGIRDDPMTMSCQPNFAILSTDGYWNGAAGQKPDATAIGNHDNVDSGYSKRADGAYDGNILPTTIAGSSAGGSGTLADVAMYFYQTDLRTTGTMATNNVPVTNKDSASYQHMVTFTLGLGLDGELSYRSDYESAGSGDFYDIKQGTKNWPSPKQDSPSALDDLWHAAVNGRGTFFSARDPATLASSLTDTLNGLNTRVGAGAAAATSNLQPVAGDNFAFTAQYQTADWIGDLKARTIDLKTGIVSSTVLWSAAAKLDPMLHTQRRIFTFDPSDSAGNRLKDFCWPSDVGAGTWCSDGSGLSAAEQAYFDPAALRQFTSYTVGQAALANGQAIVNFLRGDSTYETTSSGADIDLFRQRLSLLGDIVNAQPAYVKASPFSYSDTGYAAFKACTQGLGSGCPAEQFPSPSLPRRGTVYGASNDGMLHAFETDVNNDPYFQLTGIGTAITSDDTFQGNNAGNGVERWAYIPGILLPVLRTLADNPYAHRYYTDGSPTAGDICISTPCAGLSDWRSIVVAGFNAGGTGYFALDVTNPLAPKALWEITNKGICRAAADFAAGGIQDDCNLGLSFGNPLITKRPSDGRWVVLFTSGYNNNVSGGNGQGYLYIADAYTGDILQRVTTGVGSAASPSGFSRINGWVTSGSVDNTTLAVYGGDLLGNMWRIALEPAMPGYLQAVLLAVAKDGSGNTQPITTRPELSNISNQRVVLFGTGQFLELADKDSSTATTQTIYALRDNTTLAAGPIIADVRNTALVKVRQFANYTANDTTRSVASGTAPNWSSDWGWLIDLPEQGERVNVDPQLQLGTLTVASNIPNGDTCTAGGTAWINYIDAATGGNITTLTPQPASQKIASSLIVGVNVVMLPGGAVEAIITTADNQQLTRDAPVATGAFGGRRTSWRELFTQ